MFGNLKRFKAYFAFILAASFISFNGSYVSETINNPMVPNPNIKDIDNLEAQKFIDDNGVPVIFPYQTTTPFTMPTVDTLILPANPGPSNNGGSPGWAMFFDLIAGSRNINVTQMSTGSTAAASAGYSVIVFTRSGTALGGPVGSGPGSSPAGWTLLDTVPVVQGPTSSGISEIFTLPTISVPAGDTVGVALRFIGVGPRYFGTGTGSYSTYSDTNLTLITGDGRSAPFTTTGSWFAPRVLTGVIRYVISTATGVINIGTEIPDGFKLAQNYPNPFNPSTTIEFTIPGRSNMTLKVYNSQGQEVATLANGEYSAGTYRVRWDATGLASGAYFYCMQADNFSQTKKLLLVK